MEKNIVDVGAERVRISHALDRMQGAISAARIAVRMNEPFAECGDMLVSVAIETMKYMVACDAGRRVREQLRGDDQKSPDPHAPKTLSEAIEYLEQEARRIDEYNREEFDKVEHARLQGTTRALDRVVKLLRELSEIDSQGALRSGSAEAVGG